jgi:hypothetical protein
MPDKVRDACEACFAAHQNDCSGFARAVAAQLGLPLQGLANAIVELIESDGGWEPLADGVAAAEAAESGKFVIGGLRGSDQANPNPHGHVVVVVGGPLARNAYPSAYWGRLGGGGHRDTTVNFAWNSTDRDNVSYAARGIPLPQQ